MEGLAAGFLSSSCLGRKLLAADICGITGTAVITAGAAAAGEAEAAATGAAFPGRKLFTNRMRSFKCALSERRASFASSKRLDSSDKWSN